MLAVSSNISIRQDQIETVLVLLLLHPGRRLQVLTLPNELPGVVAATSSQRSAPTAIRPVPRTAVSPVPPPPTTGLGFRQTPNGCNCGLCRSIPRTTRIRESFEQHVMLRPLAVLPLAAHRDQRHKRQDASRCSGGQKLLGIPGELSAANTRSTVGSSSVGDPPLWA